MESDELELARAEAVKELMPLPWVQGVSIGNAAIRVMLTNSDHASEIPSQFQGIPVETVVVGDIEPGDTKL